MASGFPSRWLPWPDAAPPELAVAATLGEETSVCALVGAAGAGERGRLGVVGLPGRVERLHPGPGAIARAVDERPANGIRVLLLGYEMGAPEVWLEPEPPPRGQPAGLALDLDSALLVDHELRRWGVVGPRGADLADRLLAAGPGGGSTAEFAGLGPSGAPGRPPSADADRAGDGRPGHEPTTRAVHDRGHSSGPAGLLSPTVSDAEHARRILATLEAIAAGEIYQANVARRLRLPPEVEIDPARALRGLCALNPVAHAAHLRAGGVEVLSNSMETLLLYEPGPRRASSFPIKGTQGRDSSGAGDRGGPAFGLGAGAAGGPTFGFGTGAAGGSAAGPAFGFGPGTAGGSALGFETGAAGRTAAGSALGFETGAAGRTAAGSALGFETGTAAGPALGFGTGTGAAGGSALGFGTGAAGGPGFGFGAGTAPAFGSGTGSGAPTGFGTGAGAGTELGARTGAESGLDAPARFATAASATTLASDPKERAEHVMIVDLVRNDLGRVCVPGSIRVPELMGTHGYRGVWHGVSTVQGTLSPDHTTGDLLAALFPGGSITGAPKRRAMELIRGLEAEARGFYTGSIVLILPDGRLSASILIRTAVRDSDGWSLAVGGGIVADSRPEREITETWEKVAVFAEWLALAGAGAGGSTRDRAAEDHQLVRQVPGVV